MSAGYTAEPSTVGQSKQQQTEAFLGEADCQDAENTELFVCLFVLSSILLMTVTKRRSNIHFRAAIIRPYLVGMLEPYEHHWPICLTQAYPGSEVIESKC